MKEKKPDPSIYITAAKVISIICACTFIPRIISFIVLLLTFGLVFVRNLASQKTIVWW